MGKRYLLKEDDISGYPDTDAVFGSCVLVAILFLWVKFGFLVGALIFAPLLAVVFAFFAFAGLLVIKGIAWLVIRYQGSGDSVN
ncbi:hypothetical protein AGMMS50256_38460 [Betaproteobacteria bacterium]|nr:hypothetical protein AGMMS50256_38460 [Betaproteobacteria bacterium]